MISKLIRESLKAKVRERIRNIAKQPPFHASHAGQTSYCIGVDVRGSECGGDAAIPPRELWMGGYGGTPAAYLASGKEDVERMAGILKKAGCDMTGAKRILEFGCAAGRMIRHVPAVASKAECWGTDIGVDQIHWCRHNLTPPINFAATTTVPHLPFADSFFDVIYCGSVFTHIEDLEQAWLLELGRLLAPTGYLYLTIHDENTVRRLETDSSQHWLAKVMQKNAVYGNNKHNFNMIVIGRGEGSQVFYRASYLRGIIPPVLEWVDCFPNAYGYQSAVVLKKRALT